MSWARRAPAAAVAFAALLAATGLVLQWFLPPPSDYRWVVLWQLVVGIGFTVAGGVVTAARPVSAPGWLMLLAATLLLAAPSATAVGLVDLSNTLWLAALTVAVPLALLRIVVLRPAPVLLRVSDLLVLTTGTVTAAGAGLGAPAVAGVAATANTAVVLCAGWLIFEVTSDDDHRQVLWALLGFCLAVPTNGLLLVALDFAHLHRIPIASVMAALALALPGTVAVALINPRLVDVREVIHRIVVFIVMFVLAGALYVGAEATIEATTGASPGRSIRLIAVMTIAATFHPIMRRVRTSMDEMLFGGRADPVTTLARLGPHLAAGSSPAEWLDTLRIALAVPGVVLRAGHETVASAGATGGAYTSTTPLWADAEHVGDLIVVLPAEHVRLPPTTSAVLGLIAAPLAQALRAARLTEELRRSRGRVVSALEEERRRMRRDLHDGLGPTLTGIAYSADAAANLSRTDTDTTVAMLRQLRADAGDAIAEIRRIVYGLRPKALDELGLIRAVRQQVSHLRAADGRALAVTITAPDDLPELPAAVEVAAYRMVVEAVTNVARHAGVTCATADFAILTGPMLSIEVHNEGPAANNWEPGVGLQSMRERVEHIGGTISIDTGPGGSTVTAQIPLKFPS